MSTERAESVSHIINECKNLIHRKYKWKHDNAAWYIH